MQRQRPPLFPCPYKTQGVPTSRPAFPPHWQSVPVVPVSAPIEKGATIPVPQPARVDVPITERIDAPITECVAAPQPPPWEPLRRDAHMDSNGGGLLRYQKHWYLCRSEVKVGDELLSGTPIGFKDNTLCLINKEHRYFIPLRKVDYIRTPEGLDSSFDDGCDQ